ncbi:MAG: spore cortex biosynthesis protein YabQ [Defluviitaleaceae bacterium]|nr:spore cortex biosynthesis protein YabQ [Defluviitaleaceae bacterium]
MSLNNQLHLLIHTLLYGIFLGLCFDTFNLVLGHFAKKTCHNILFILYWVIQLPLAILFFHRVNRGEFQSYLLVFALLGGGLYFKIFQKAYMKELKMLLKMCRHLLIGIRKVLNVLIFTPIAFIFKVIFDIIVIPKKIFRKKRSDEDEARHWQDGEVQGDSK